MPQRHTGLKEAQPHSFLILALNRGKYVVTLFNIHFHLVIIYRRFYTHNILII